MNAAIAGLPSDPWAQRVGWALVHFLWQGAAVALMLAVALRLMRRASPQLRWAAACAALALMAALPVATALLVSIRPVSTRAAIESAQVLPAPLEGEIGRAATGAPLTPSLSPRERGTPWAAPLQATPWRERVRAAVEPYLPWAVLAWLAGVVALTVWHLGGWWHLARSKRRDTSPAGGAVAGIFERLVARLRVSRPVRLLESARVAVPVVIGWLRPVILLPASAVTGLTPAQLEAVLAHELAHVRRHDCLVRMLQAAVETLLFYHPAVWWVSGRIRQESEECCDEVAVGVCGDRHGYAEALVQCAEAGRERARLAAMAGGGNMLSRIRRIVGMEQRTEGFSSRWFSGVVVTAIVALLLAGACVHVRASGTSAQPGAWAATDEDLPYEDLKKVCTEEALQLAQTGGDGKSLEEAVRRALAFDQDELTRLQLYVYLGDAIWRQTEKYTPEVWGPQRRKAAEAYLTGLADVLQHDLPAEAPDLPAVGVYNVDGPPEVVQKYRQQHAEEMAARKEAERIRELVHFRQTLTGQVVQMYAREPDAFEELFRLASAYLESAEAAQALVEGAKAYRADPAAPRPVLGAEPWGEAVEGVQVRLRADRKAWGPREEPTFSVDVRNVDSAGLHGMVPAGVEIDFDGARYGWWPGDALLLLDDFGPGREHLGVYRIVLDGSWQDPRDFTTPSLRPGKHAVSVIVRSSLRPDDPRSPFVAVSNPVEIEVLPAGEGATLSVEDICKGMEAQSAKIADIEVHFDWIHGRLEEQDDGALRFVPCWIEDKGEGEVTEGEFGFLDCVWKEKGQKAFLERNIVQPMPDPSGGESRIARSLARFAWNGKQGRTFSHSEGVDYSQGWISGEPNGNLLVQWRMPFLFTDRMWREQGETLAELFRRKGAEVLSLDEEIDGRRCALVLVRGHFAEGIDERYWLDVERGFSLVRFERQDGLGRTVWTLQDIVLREAAPGVWYPVQGFTCDPHKGGAARYSARLVKVNQGLPDSDFTIEFPPGTSVTDRRERLGGAEEPGRSGPADVAARFLKALGEGEVEKALGQAQPGLIRDPDSLPDVVKQFDFSGAAVTEAWAAREDACAVTGPFAAPGGRVALGLGLRKYGDRWLVRDMDWLPDEKERSAWFEKFHRSYPDAKKIEVRSDTGKTLAFGPVIELDVPDLGLLDLDRGEMMRPPAHLDGADGEAMVEWTRETGADLAAATEPMDGWRGLVGYDMATGPVSTAETWDQVTANHVAELTGRLREATPAWMPRRTGSLPVVAGSAYAFKTREGGMGILQIVGFTEDPKGVRIRYKMVQRAEEAPAQDARAPSPGVTTRGPRWVTSDAPIEDSQCALAFDGVSRFVEVSDSPSLDLTGPFTLEAWINFEVGGDTNPRIISKGWESRGGYELAVYGTGEERRLAFLATGGELGRRYSNALLRAGEWCHVAATFDGISVSLYVNGERDISRNVTGGVTPLSVPMNDFPLNIGRNSGTAREMLKGVIDEVRIWDAARSAEAIRRDMRNRLTGNEAGLVAYWRFEEGEAESVHDGTPNENDGRLSTASDRRTAPRAMWYR